MLLASMILQNGPIGNQEKVAYNPTFRELGIQRGRSMFSDCLISDTSDIKTINQGYFNERVVGSLNDGLRRNGGWAQEMKASWNTFPRPIRPTSVVSPSSMHMATYAYPDSIK